MTTSTLIIGATPRVVIPLARCLAQHGISVVAASLMPGTPQMRSRSLVGYRYLRPPALSPELFREDLARVAEEFGVDTIIPTGDEVLSALALHEEAWRSRMHLLCPPAATFRKVLDKGETLQAAESEGVPIPQTRVLTDGDELDSVLRGFRFPAIVKPADKGRETTLRLRYLEARRDLEKLMASHFRRGDAWMLQEFVPGHGVGVEVLMHAGEPIATFQHRRLKEYPVAGGVAARCLGETPDPELLEHSLRLLRALEWEGVAMVEFRHDPESGRTALMEINGRYWGSIALPLQSGVEFPWYQWQLAHGQTPEPKGYQPGQRMRWLAGDLQRLPEAAAAALAREYPARRAAADTGTFLADFVAPHTRDALWSWRDPGPALRDLGRAVGQVSAQIWNKIARRALPWRWYAALRPIMRLNAGGVVRYAALGLRATPPAPSEQTIRSARSVVFVCHGNIIRSAFAAGWLGRILGEQGHACGITIRSAGLCAEDGNPAHPDARAAAERFGISLEAHRAQRLDRETVQQADLIFIMDRLHRVRMQQQFPEAAARTYLLGALHPDKRFARDGQQIRDPYDKGTEAVAKCLEGLRPCVEALAGIGTAKPESAR